MAKKRANGDGSIRKRKDGRWEGRYVVGHDPVTGKMISRNVLGKTQAEVKEKLRTAIENSKRLDYTQTGKYTVGQWMDEWFEAYAKVKVEKCGFTSKRKTINTSPFGEQILVEGNQKMVEKAFSML